MTDKATNELLNGTTLAEVVAEYDNAKANDARLYADKLRVIEAGRKTVEYIEPKAIPSKFRGNSTMTIRGLNTITVLSGVNPRYAQRLTQIYAEQPKDEFYENVEQLSIARLQMLERQDLLLSDSKRRADIRALQSKSQLEEVA